jgi:glycosyltransferase involved in cell wall biosynthesis
MQASGMSSGLSFMGDTKRIMKKILIVSTVSRQFYLFEQGNIEVLKSLDYEVHCAANFEDANERLEALDIIRHHFDIQRSPFSFRNIKAYKQLKKIMQSDRFNAVHCHSPMGGVLARLAAKSVGIPMVLYTAHGFHFYKGAPLMNWIIYYPVEKWLSRYTDILITINKEDYNRAQRFKAKKIVYVPGIGVDTGKFDDETINRAKKRKELEISNDTIVLLSVGEMIKRKNHDTALKAISELKNKNYIYLICGQGELETYLKDLANKLGVSEKVRFLGFRDDIPEICAMSDIFIFPSYQEGLPVAAMEAMAAGLPVICSNIRGNVDLIQDGEGGYLLEPGDYIEIALSIDKVIKDDKLRINMGFRNKEEVKKCDKKVVKEKMKKIYLTVLR